MKTFKPFNVNMKICLAIFVVAVGGATSPPLLAQGCCGSAGTMKESCGMGAGGTSHGHGEHGAQALAASQSSPSKSVFMQPVQSVFDGYIGIQGTLAQDSLEGVSQTAAEMAKAIRGDSMKMLSPKVAEQAEALAQAKSLEAARGAYKALSDSLINYMKTQKLPPGTYYEAYCPMAKASWLQTDKTVINPYMGKAMVHCGQLKG
jgi:hypothetical protein